MIGERSPASGPIPSLRHGVLGLDTRCFHSTRPPFGRSSIDDSGSRYRTRRLVFCCLCTGSRITVRVTPRRACENASENCLPYSRPFAQVGREYFIALLNLFSDNVQQWRCLQGSSDTALHSAKDGPKEMTGMIAPWPAREGRDCR